MPSLLRGSASWPGSIVRPERGPTSPASLAAQRSARGRASWAQGGWTRSRAADNGRTTQGGALTSPGAREAAHPAVWLKGEADRQAAWRKCSRASAAPPSCCPPTVSRGSLRVTGGRGVVANSGSLCRWTRPRGLMGGQAARTSPAHSSEGRPSAMAARWGPCPETPSAQESSRGWQLRSSGAHHPRGHGGTGREASH